MDFVFDATAFGKRNQVIDPIIGRPVVESREQDPGLFNDVDTFQNFSQQLFDFLGILNPT
jgi:hypothetical protein